MAGGGCKGVGWGWRFVNPKFHQIASIADVTFSTFCHLMQGKFDPNNPKGLIFPQIEATREGSFATFLTSNAVYIFF